MRSKQLACGVLGATLVLMISSPSGALAETKQECVRRGIARAADLAEQSRTIARTFNNERRMFQDVSEEMLASAYELSPGSITVESMRDPGPWMQQHVGHYFVADGILLALSTDPDDPDAALALRVALDEGETADVAGHLLTNRQRGFLQDYCNVYECKGRFAFKAQRASNGKYLTMELVAADIAPLNPDVIYSKVKAEDSLLLTKDCKDRWWK